jgi:ABC-type transport system substrate-binding protein
MLIATPVLAANGPKTSNLIIHIFNTETAEFEAFQSATGADAIDFVDWPLPKDKVDLWQTAPYNSYIQFRDTNETDSFGIDLNNQRWPTGVNEPRTFDPATGTYKHWFGTNEPWDSKAVEFRKAIAYLSNKDKWITDILKGYGYRLDTNVPRVLDGYTNYQDLDTSGYIYHYDPVKAAQVLDAAGFTQGTTPNPDYDPLTPSSAQYLRTDPRYGGNLGALTFYIRMDDVLRRDMGRDLTAQLRKAGIQVNAIETDKTQCYDYVMVLYDYHLYTGGTDIVGLDVDIPDSLYNLFHSSQYHGGSATSYYGGVGWSHNYIGFADATFDAYAEQGKFAGTFEGAKTGALYAQKRAAELVHSIPAYNRVSPKAFKTGWLGVVNQVGAGPDNKWSFLNTANSVNTPQNPADNVIDWGFENHLSSPNPISAQWLWDRNLINLVYDSMLGRNPYDLSMEYGFAAESWSFDAGTRSALFKLRPGLTFHNGDPVTPEDIKFSLEFQKAAGPGVAWDYSEVAPILHVDTQTDDPALGSRDVRVYFTEASYWAVHWAGFRRILNHNTWMAVNAHDGWGYTRGMTDFNLFTNRWLVRNYQPWESDVDSDGTNDFTEDGSGPWTYQSYAPPGSIDTATSVLLTAFSNYAISQDAIPSFLTWAFHMIGDTNEDGSIDGVDGLTLQKAFGTDSTMLPWGTGWDQYNPAADINTATWNMVTQTPLSQGDGSADILDVAKWSVNYGLQDDPPGGTQAANYWNHMSLHPSESPQTSNQNLLIGTLGTTPRMYVDTYPPSGSGNMISEALRPGQIPISGANLINSFPSNYATNGSVTNPTYAYDASTSTSADFAFGSATPKMTWFEVKGFNTSIANPYHVLGIDVKIDYSVTLTGAQYHIVATVGSKQTEMQTWTPAIRPTHNLRTFPNVREPNDGVWNWTDISNLRVRIEGKNTTNTGTGTFKNYETWISLPTDRLVIGVAVQDAQNVFAYQFNLNWTGPILNVTRVSEGSFLRRGNTMFIAKTFNGPSGNRTVIGGVLLGRSIVPRGLDGDGTLAYVEFLVESYGSTKLTLYKTMLFNFGYPFAHTTTNGWFDNRLPGDADSDHDVDYNDFVILAGAYGSILGQPAYKEQADFDHDDDIDYSDFVKLAGNYGKTLP